MGTFASGIKCSSCLKGISIPIDPLVNTSEWRCIKCDQKLPTSQVISVLNRARSSLDAINKKSIQECERFLSEFGAVLPASSVFIADVNFALCMLYGNVDGFMMEGNF